MRVVAALLCVAGCLPSPEPPATAGEVAARFRAVLDAEVALVEDGSIYCSGVWWRDQIVTAAHCVEEGVDPRYAVYRDYSYDGNQITRSYVSRIVDVDHTQDLALLKPEGAGPEGQYRNLLLSTQRPYIGQRVFAVGHPYGMGWHIAEGRVVAPGRLGAFEVDEAWMQTNVPVHPGMSGGPLIDEDGTIVGISKFYVGRMVGVSGHTPVSAVRAFLAGE